MYGNYDNRKQYSKSFCSCWRLIIRFRTVVKDTKDIAYIFWSLSAGLAAGTVITAIGTVIISLVSIILFKSNYGSIYKRISTSISVCKE